jgi:2-phospho-L-lactate guanylyltransferase
VTSEPAPTGVDAGPPAGGGGLGRLFAVVPIRSLEGAKSRLGGLLDAEERQDLVRLLLERTIAAARATPAIDTVVVVSPDPVVLELAGRLGGHPLAQIWPDHVWPDHDGGSSGGLNEGLAEAIQWAGAAGAEAVLILPADLPSISPAAIHQVVATAAAALVPGRPLVLVVPDRHGRGTNALLLRPPDVIRPSFGEDSRLAHQAAAARAGALAIELDGPLGLDLDLPADLSLAEELGLLDPADGG